MDREELEALVKDCLSQRQIAAKYNCSQSRVKHWLKKYGLATQRTGYVPPNNCIVCGKETRRRRLCQGHYTKLRRYRTKTKAVALLGGKCNRCGWTGNHAALEFHHNNGDKDFNIGQVANKSWKAIKEELKKCELVCANCHRIEHSNHAEPGFIEALRLYPGIIE